ncbi:hypothetical protein ACQZ4Q_23360 [Agrobacterium vitis]
MQPLDAGILEDEIDGLEDDDLVTVEVELIYRAFASVAAAAESAVVHAISRAGGVLVHRARIEDIAYHALLARIPAASIRMLIAGAPGSLAS